MKLKKVKTYLIILFIVFPIILTPLVFMRHRDLNKDFKQSPAIATMAPSYVQQPQDGSIDINAFKTMVEGNNINKVHYNESDPALLGVSKTGKPVMFQNPKNPQFRQYLMEHKVAIEETSNLYIKATGFIILGIAVIGVIQLMVWYKKKEPFSAGVKIESQEFNECKDINVKFTDVAGNEEAKENMKDIIEFLRDGEKFRKFGAKIPKGVILYGPPGTGKTLLAKALAGETGSTFIPTSGSYFVEKYVGIGASRVRKLFSEARKKVPAIIFIDEIDAVGGKRGAEGQGTSEDAKTLNQLLVEMDGFKDDENIIVVAATNRLDMLDDALIRAGRFDRHVMVALPDLNARHEILKVHSKNKPLSEEVNLMQVAKQTVYMSGADLAGVMNEAAIYAIKDNCMEITPVHIDKAINKMIAGDEKKDRSNISDLEKRITAYHEAGHALVAKLLNGESVPKISIIPTTKGAAGYTIINPDEKMFQTKKEILNEISGLLGGRAAEEVIFGKHNITGGASNDLQRATKMALTLITKYGMSEKLGLVSFDDREISLKNEVLLNETKEILDQIYKNTLEYMNVNKVKLEAIAQMLLDKEVMSEYELEKLLIV